MLVFVRYGTSKCLERPCTKLMSNLSGHAIPHVGSKGLARELDTQPFCKCTVSLSIWGNVSHSLAPSPSLSVSTHPQPTLPLVLSASLTFSLATCPSLSCSLSHSLNASPSYSSACSLCKLIWSGQTLPSLIRLGSVSS